ncbi:unnamed protein product [Bursaphelenchus xylophilus]|uniref:(pine wood nematode) hypothetical protein n=1 Tax=Bursaphelenchus xylophilus TaxID=6326 RepID=A0A7I8XD39_BURXY|nr:unnamed protein product [Bursaphelenchus xylophilus]CAG9131751.1 unnamed protein product [Bursaphelenchus xylophilus]
MPDRLASRCDREVRAKDATWPPDGELTYRLTRPQGRPKKRKAQENGHIYSPTWNVTSYHQLPRKPYPQETPEGADSWNLESSTASAGLARISNLAMKISGLIRCSNLTEIMRKDGQARRYIKTVPAERRATFEDALCQFRIHEQWSA